MQTLTTRIPTIIGSISINTALSKLLGIYDPLLKILYSDGQHSLGFRVTDSHTESCGLHFETVVCWILLFYLLHC